MSNILARCTAVGLVAGGFALTGDLGRLADRGLKVLNASDVPVAASTSEAGQSVTASTVPSEPAAGSAGEPVPDGPASLPPPQADAALPEVTRTVDFRPPVSGVGQVVVSSLEAGQRLVIWLKVDRRTAAAAYRCLVFDMVDPRTAEALLYEAVSFGPDGQPKATATPPCRVMIEGDAGALIPGGSARIHHKGIALGDHPGAGDRIGPIVSLDVIQ